MSSPILGPKTLEILKDPIYHVWQQISPDAMEFVENNEDAIEICIDAGRLIIHGDFREEHDYLIDILDCYGYRKVLKYLSNNIQLV